MDHTVTILKINLKIKHFATDMDLLIMPPPPHAEGVGDLLFLVWIPSASALA